MKKRFEILSNVFVFKYISMYLTRFLLAKAEFKKKLLMINMSFKFV